MERRWHAAGLAEIILPRATIIIAPCRTEITNYLYSVHHQLSFLSRHDTLPLPAGLSRARARYDGHTLPNGEDPQVSKIKVATSSLATQVGFGVLRPPVPFPSPFLHIYLSSVVLLSLTQGPELHRKTERPGFVETPGRRITRSRASMTPDVSADDVSDMSPAEAVAEFKSTRRRTAVKAKAESASEEEKNDAQTNGHANGFAKKPKIIDGWEEGKDPKIDYSGRFEFGGSWGVLSMMIGFPLLMYYMWIGATYYDGKLPLPSEGQSLSDFFAHLGHLVYEGAFPSLKAWTIYWVFFVFEALCYMFLPGITLQGRPLPHEGGKQLTYYCSAIWSWYTTIFVALALHATGLFKLYTLIDEFGPLMSVAILSGFLVSFIAYFSAIARGAQHRMSGYPIYDFFMGAELNPRMFGILDFKMFFEVRLPWYILFLITLGAAARQYEMYGYVSGEVGFLLLAHFLYANACSKGEECIVSTW